MDSAFEGTLPIKWNLRDIHLIPKNFKLDLFPPQILLKYCLKIKDF